MLNFRFLQAVLALALATLSIGYATPAAAQATRTWVSGVGDDANPCSRTAPCKTFAGAISKTATGGEINCLDPGGYGAVTITKSITLYCPFTGAGILVAGTSAIIVNDGGAGTAVVTLDGLNIEGLGFAPTAPGIRGISFISGASLTVQNTRIRGFRDSSIGAGIGFAPSTANAKLTVIDSEITGNSNTAAGAGIFVQPTGTGSARVSVTNTLLSNNTNAGFRVDTTSNTGNGVVASLDGATITGGAFGVIANQPAGAAPISILISDSTIANNATFGVAASGANSRIRVGRSTITNSGTAAFAASGGVVNSFGNNLVAGNTNDGTFTVIPQS